MYLGNQPALSYTSFAKQDFTTSATTSYTLDNPVANANELALFINFVRQEPTTAYSASGTSLTLTSATSASDDMYCVYLGKAVQTVNPPNGSVDSSKINYPLTTFSSTGIDDNATSTAVTINSSGNLLIGTTSAQRNDREAVEVKNTTGEAFFASTNGLSYAGYTYKSLQSTGGTHYIAWFENSSGTNVGKITHNNSSTSFTTSSDYRLKENVDYTFDATTRLKQLKPARFNFIVDADKTVDGFLAHEVSSVVPEAITGEKDAVDENGNPEYQGIDQSKLVPLLVKTIQELEARITTLENA